MCVCVVLSSMHKHLISRFLIYFWIEICIFIYPFFTSKASSFDSQIWAQNKVKWGDKSLIKMTTEVYDGKATLGYIIESRMPANYLFLKGWRFIIQVYF